MSSILATKGAIKPNPESANESYHVDTRFAAEHHVNKLALSKGAA